MRQYLTGALLVLMAIGVAGLFALGIFFASAIVFIRYGLEQLNDLRERVGRKF